MKLAPPANINYSATVVRIPAVVTLEKLDFLVGVPVLGHQALTQKDGATVGDLKVCFTAETQLSHEYAHHNNLYREAELNADPNEKGYLEKNRRVRALKLKGHRSDALLMPLESLAPILAGGQPIADWEKALLIESFQEGDTFDRLGDFEVCRKYEIPVKPNPRGASKIVKAFKRVDKKIFPEHLETDAYWRSKHILRPGREVIITQKLHGTSLRVGRVPCLREKGRIEKFLNRWFPTVDHTYDAVFGSRKVIKDVNNPNQDHYYDSDIWTEYGKTIADLIPEGYIVYGELIGFTPDGAAIQKSYTYEAAPGKSELYVYRVATINAQGTLADLSWDAVKEFCIARGLKWTPEMARFTFGIGDEGAFRDLNEVDTWIDDVMDTRYADHYDEHIAGYSYPDTIERPLQLSDPKSVDEGVCLRQEGIVPTILKAKSAKFLEHETKLLDKGESDLEAAA